MAEKNIWIGLSGGVDSSVAAALLQEQGHDVTGVYLKCWEDTLPDGSCPWEEDQKDAQAVAGVLGIPFRSINLVKPYRERVFQYMLDEYKAGRTPNPDVVCNREIKFGLFLEEALAADADAVATGHYARLAYKRSAANGNAKPRETVQLLAGVDGNKDQSYFLWQLKQEQLRHALFPIGHMQKAQVRAEAQRRGLKTATKPDSTGVCFVGEVPMQEFLERFIAPNPGPVLTSAGKQVGEHRGLHYYTIGQRKGIGVTGGGPPYFVAEKDEARNALVVVSPAEEGNSLYATELLADSVNWISPTSSLNGGGETSTINVLARIRYRQPLQHATVMQNGGGDLPAGRQGPSTIRVVFDEPQRAVTPGQSVVFYDGDIMLGGGVIR